MSFYDLKVMIFLQELLSVIVTPFVLWFSLPKCSDRIVDFFREFTVHVDGIGYVCSFAMFDFKRNGSTKVCQILPFPVSCRALADMYRALSITPQRTIR